MRLAELADFAGYALVHGDLPSALHYAAGCGCLEACATLLTRCGRLNFATDAARQTPLFWAVESGLCRTADLLLQHGADALHLDAEGLSPLHLAARSGLAATCQRLLQVPAVMREGLPCAAYRGMTPLHCAAQNGHCEAARLLLAHGAEPAALTPQSRTPLHLAAQEGHEARASHRGEKSLSQ